MNNKLISVIIPIFNTAEFLKACIESVLNQDYENIEIIAVNDGSTDESLDILRDIASKNKKVIVVNQPNQGLASARNVGIEASNGELLSFVDSDDLLDYNMLSTMCSALVDNNADIVTCNYTKDMKLKYNCHISKEEDNVIEVTDVCSFLNQYFYNEYKSSVCLKLIKKEIISTRIRFIDKAITPEEDVLFSLKILSSAHRVVFINHPFYHYRTRPGSITHSYNSDVLFVERMVYAVELYRLFVDQYGDKSNMTAFYSYYFIASLSSGINNLKQASFMDIVWIVKRINKRRHSKEYCRFVSKYGIQMRGLPKGYCFFSRCIAFALSHHLQILGCVFLFARAKMIQYKRQRGNNCYM